MKKILVVIMILAVAGGVFAQEGRWSFAGSIEIGTRLNFDPVAGTQLIPGLPDPAKLPNEEDQVATARGNNFNAWDAPKAKIGLTYNRGPMEIKFDFNSRGEHETGITFSGDNYKAQGIVNNLLSILQSSYPNNIKRLWGEYNMLDGLFNLVVAFRSADTQYWASNTVGAFMNDNLGNSMRNPHIMMGAPGGNGYFGHSFFADDMTFTKVDQHNYMLGNLKFSGLELGLMIPNIFGNGNGGPNSYTQEDDKWTATGWQYPTHSMPWNTDNNGGLQLVEDVLLKSILGVKFVMSPFEIAMQFRPDDMGTYFGGNVDIGPVKAGLSFMGIFPDPEKRHRMQVLGSPIDDRIKIGGGVTYNAGAFGANLNGSLDKTVLFEEVATVQVLSINPGFWYNVIPSHLAFQLDTGFYFASIEAGDETESEFYYAVSPQLYWNFKGTGASRGYAWGASGSGRTGVAVRYRVVSKAANVLDLVFNWAF
jgi:hypothetical protein